jgi:hypothetical protein
VKISNLVLVVFACTCVGMAGCQKRTYEGPERFPLDGKVTVDGEPVDEGRISFTDPGGGEGLRLAGGDINNGTFSVPEEMGPTAGTYRVHISWLKKTGKKYRAPDTSDEVYYDERKEVLPQKFRGPESELRAKVPSDDGSYNFDLKLK